MTATSVNVKQQDVRSRVFLLLGTVKPAVRFQGPQHTMTSSIWTKTVLVGSRECRMIIDKRGWRTEWFPSRPAALTANERAQYVAGKNALMREVSASFASANAVGLSPDGTKETEPDGQSAV